MRPLALSQIARWCDARLVGDDLVVQAIGIDMRMLVPGSVYVAVRGEVHDGHVFCAQAEASGARALLVEHEVESTLPGGERMKYSGTSMASPNVANLAAKLLALEPKLSVAEVIALIQQGCERSADGRINLINPKKSVELLQTRKS